jgi:6-phosphogluconolactonase
LTGPTSGSGPHETAAGHGQPGARGAAGGPGEPVIEILADPEAVSRAAAERIAAALRDAVDERGRADWTTTGGSTPVGIYRQLAIPPLVEVVPWDRVHVWWGDDRVVPRDHPLSNVLPFDQVLLVASARAGLSGWGGDAVLVDAGRIPAPAILPENVHPIPMDLAIRVGTSPEAGAAAAAAAYAAELRRAELPLTDGVPAFDVVLLGVGPDGHLFSVFPGSALFDSDAWVGAVPAPEHVEPHVERVSLHPAIVEAARLPLVVIHGAAKAEVVAAVLGPERDVRRWPAQLARRPGGLWLLDRAAAARLGG